MIGQNLINRVAREVSDEVRVKEFYSSLTPEEKKVLGVREWLIEQFSENIKMIILLVYIWKII